MKMKILLKTQAELILIQEISLKETQGGINVKQVAIKPNEGKIKINVCTGTKDRKLKYVDTKAALSIIITMNGK